MTKKHQVAKGENLLVIAERELFGTNWQAIYFAEENKPLRDRRQESIRHLYPRLEVGESIVIPARPRAQLVAGSKAILVRENSDFIARARALHSTYLSQHKLHEDWLKNPGRVRELCLAEWTRTLLEQGNGNFDGRVDKAALQAFFDDYQKTSWLQVMAFASTCRELVDLLRLKSFKSQIDKLEKKEKADCYAELVTDLFLCREAWGFLQQEFDKFEKNDAGATITDVFAIAEDANSAFWDLLAAFGPTIVKQKKSEALIYIKKLITKRVPYVVATQLEASVVLFRQEYATSIIATIEPITVTVLTPEHIKLADTPAMERRESQLNKAFAVINAAFSIEAVLKTPDLKNSLSTVGALLSVLSEYSAALNALMGRQVLTKVAKLSFTVVSGILDMIVSKMEAEERAAYGDTNAAFAHTVAAGGAGLMATGAFMTFAEGMLAGGAATSLTGVGAIVAAIGLILVFVGGIAAMLCEDSEVESWLENSRFGTKRDTPADVYLEKTKDWRADHARQLRELFDIIATVDASAEFSTHGAEKMTGVMATMDADRHENDLRLFIKPSLMLTCSQVNLTVELSWGDRARSVVALNNFLIRFSSGSEGIIGRPSPVAGSAVVWDPKRIVKKLVIDFHRPSELPSGDLARKRDVRADLPYSKARVLLRVDLFGDGRIVYYRRADLEPEVWEMLMRVYDFGTTVPVIGGGAID